MRNHMLTALAAAWMLTGAAAAVASEPVDLEQAVSLACRNHPLIREAAASSRAAVAAHRASRADRLPRAQAAYRYAHLKETPFMYFNTYEIVSGGPAVGGAGVIAGSRRIEAPTGPLDNFHWEVSLTQPLFTGFALTTRVRMAALGIAIGRVEEDQATADVVKQAKLRYFDVLMAGRFVETARAAEETLAAHVADAEHFFDQGLIPLNDLLQSRVALADAVQRRAEAEAGLETAVAALNTVIGFELAADTRVSPVADAPPPPPPLAALVQRAEAQRSELRLLDLHLDRLAAAARLAASAYYPSVALVGRYEQDGDDPRATENEFRNSYNTTVAVQAEWTFFEWGKTRAEVARARRQRDALQARADGVRDSVRLEVQNARSRLAVALANIRTAEAAVRQAEENLRITRLRYQEQVAPSTEVLDATTARSRAETNFHAARYQAFKAAAELERAVGERVRAGDRTDEP